MHIPQAPYPQLDPNAVLWSSELSAESDLLIMMHGWSYDERHLFALRDELPTDLVIASVRAPVPEAGGYAWFPGAGNPIGDPQPAVANAAADVVLDWCNSLPTLRSVGLLGFSQGGAMVLQMMRRRPGVFAYGVQLGGFVVNDTQPGDGALREERPPVFWGRGAHDWVIPDAAVRRTATFSAQHLSITERVYPDLGHDVAGREVTDFAAFVTAQIARP
jgi:phospholipase/carboxylesterase